ncbi:MAG: hypothetical protein HN736_14790 [Anaerolineae bacterium]|nr:hypothetical protein [Anaerolineae bacterium]MBT7483581.1 hypothetical protein [Candidatus Peregrinibacteria bacterium]MBT3714120.1 hypothetical protein [Anaerolineae bacterium]MBT4310844.1 hypothetical protein [Anaerolineae bacterium]MBT4458479.1 hypothetical protein [Anaerolineae bacterium]
MKNFIQKKLFLLLISLLILLSSCNREFKDAVETPTLQASVEFTYCNINSSNLCIEGFGKENENKTIILFKIEKANFPNFYLRVNESQEDITYTCSSSQDFPRNAYCVGEIFPNNEKISIDVYATESDSLIVTGEFTIQYGKLKTPEDLNAPQNPSQPDYPNYSDYPNYPNYPNNYSYPFNPSYPNYPNSAP